eukprot:jgi/Tetstr1/465548/TSEL_010217.t1
MSPITASLPSSCRSLAPTPDFGRQRGGRRGKTRTGASGLSVVRAEGGRQQWDFGRFVKTVTTFNPPPSLPDMVAAVVVEPLRLINSLTAEQAQATEAVKAVVGSPATAGTPLVLVADAAGPLGRRVVQRLLLEGKQVRGLVRDVAAAKEQLKGLQAAAGGGLELVAADLSSPPTAAMLSGVRSAINCGGPQVLSAMLPAAARALGCLEGQAVFDASDHALRMDWAPLDDVVMGGCSLGRWELADGAGEGGAPAALFRGTVSTDNSGGFSSVRTLNMEPPLNLAAYTGIRLRVRGDGQRYKFILRTDRNWDTVTYCQSFDTAEGEWQDVRLPFERFIPVFRARSMPDGDPLDSSNIVSLQLMLSKFEYDGALNPSFSPGSFQLPVAAISAYMQPPVPARFIHIAPSGAQAAEEAAAVRRSGMPHAVVEYGGEDYERAAALAVEALAQEAAPGAAVRGRGQP